MSEPQDFEDWNEALHAVSEAFELWKIDQRDIRVFMRLGLRFAREVYHRIWGDVGGQPVDEDDDPLGLVFDRAVDGLWPHDFEWMHMAAVVKDAVTAYEVYLEKGMYEILKHHGMVYTPKNPEQSPWWSEIARFYSHYLGVQVAPKNIAHIRDLRHILTHQRGELRTETERRRFQSTDDFSAIVATLRENEVEILLDVLEREVRRIDPSVYQFSWSGARINELLQRGS